MTSAPSPAERQPGKRATRPSKDGSRRSFPKVPHLLQYVRSGAYYARVKIRGKIIRQSLAANVFSTAKLKLLDFIKERRAQFEPKEPPHIPHAFVRRLPPRPTTARPDVAVLWPLGLLRHERFCALDIQVNSGPQSLHIIFR